MRSDLSPVAPVAHHGQSRALMVLFGSLVTAGLALVGLALWLAGTLVTSPQVHEAVQRLASQAHSGSTHADRPDTLRQVDAASVESSEEAGPDTPMSAESVDLVGMDPGEYELTSTTWDRMESSPLGVTTMRVQILESDGMVRVEWQEPVAKECASTKCIRSLDWQPVEPS